MSRRTVHDFFMGEGYRATVSDWDRGLTTEQLVERVTKQLRQEDDGDRLTIIVATREIDEPTEVPS